MVGTPQLARAPTDGDLSDQLLAQGVETGFDAAERPSMTALQKPARRSARPLLLSKQGERRT
jgi:hypothetical protein